MALSQTQINQLNALAGKTNLTAQDKANLAFAQKNYGYKLPTIPMGATAINGLQYNTRDLQQQNFSNIFQQGNTLYGTPKIPMIPTKLTPDQFNSTTDINTNSLPFQYDPNSFVASSNAYFDQVMKDYQTSKDEAAKLQEQQTTQRGTISKLMETIGGKGQDYQNQLNNLGVTENTNQLQDLNKQIAAKNAEYQKLSTTMENEASGRGITTGILRGQQEMLQRQQASEVGALTSMAQALQGNITLAYQTAEKSINLKYEPLENQLKLELQQLDNIYQDLSASEKKKADAQTTLLEERLRLINEQKDHETQVHNIMIEAAKNGADTNTLNKILTSKNSNEAIVNAGGFIAPKKENNFDQITDKATGDVIGYFDSKTGKTVYYNLDRNPNLTDVEKGVVGGYDIKSYATDPNHEKSVSNIYNRLLNNGSDFNAIQSVLSQYGAKFTAEQVLDSAKQYDVDPLMMMAIMEQDSSYGTKGKGARTYNPGNVGNTDSGAEVKHRSWQDGLDALAKNLAGRKVSPSNNMSDTDAIAAAIINGTQPPDLKGLYGKSAAVKAALSKQGYDLTKAQSDWLATTKYLTSLNSTQQLRLRQAVDFTYESLDVVDDLAKQWKDLKLSGQYKDVNKAAINAAKKGLLGQQAQSIATQLDNQLSDLVSELATVYKGGNSSTDQSLNLSAEQLKSSWSYKTLIDNVDLIRRNLQIRRNSLASGSPSTLTGSNQYEPTTPVDNDPLGIFR